MCTSSPVFTCHAHSRNEHAHRCSEHNFICTPLPRWQVTSGMSKIERLEESVHGRKRNLEDRDDLRFGVHDEMLYARNREPVQGAQWTGIVTRVAIEMLQSGAVDAVVCVQSAEDDRCATYAHVQA